MKVIFVILISFYLYDISIASDRCSQEPEKGLCKASIRKFYFDSNSGKCKEFTYGGCGGNDNKFDSEEECEKACSNKINLNGLINGDKSICELDSDSGLCLAYIERYFYNKKTGKCQLFVYGGCGGNGNNFETLEKCQLKCGSKKDSKVNLEDSIEDKESLEESLHTISKRLSEKSEDICKLDKKVGTCKGAFPRYYFNYKSGKCEEFTYGGCGGNENNFESLEKCQSKCGSKNEILFDHEESDEEGYEVKTIIQEDSGENSNTNICELPAVTGPCRAKLERYFFHKNSGSCEKFFYGGCKGNENNFKTIEECSSKCPSQNSENICHLPRKSGPCRGYYFRYYFNKESNKCEGFVYGGCQGNGNNFETVEECQLTCSEQNSENVCHLPKKPGPCEAYIERYYFNKETGKCEQFIYGGCQGNANNFETIDLCQSTCSVANIHPDCKVPQKVGPCLALIPKYFYNQTSGQCELFSWGGCKPNSNNFPTLLTCKRKCFNKSPQQVCYQKPLVGSCKAAMPRYYYNPESKSCQQFSYGGCGGNENHFETPTECETFCSSVVSPKN